MRDPKHYIDKMREWMFGVDDRTERPPREFQKLEKQERRRQIPELGEVKMQHYYPKEKRNTAEPLKPLERKKTKTESKPPARNKPKTEAKPPEERPAWRKQPLEKRRRSSGSEEQAVPKPPKKRPDVYSRGPFKAQEIPSPIYGLQLQRERVKRRREALYPSAAHEVEAEGQTLEQLGVPKAEQPAELPATEQPEGLPDVAEGYGEQLIKAKDEASADRAKNELADAVEEVYEAEEIVPAPGPDQEEPAVSGVEPVRAAAEPVPPAEPKRSASEQSDWKAGLSREERKQLKEAASAPPPQKERRKPEVQSVRRKQEDAKVPFNVMMQPSDKRKARKHDEGYQKPELHLLSIPPKRDENLDSWAGETAQKLNETMAYFRVRAEVVTYTSGPSVTRFELQPEPGVKINKIVQLTDDLKRSLAATEIRIEAPIPGKTTVGIEVPNPSAVPVMLRTILRDNAFREAGSPLTVALGMDIGGNAITTDIGSMPHGLIAGTTGSGKSVCVNSMLLSLLYKASPDEVRLLLIDPKMVELAPFNDVPHLAAPVITDTKEATAALKWAVEEMERRYQLFAKTGSRDLERYNNKAEKKLPRLVIVVDELADLMMVAPQEVEDAICRIAQKARACGIHLLVATQRPSVDVITGLIKANIPSRIAFSVSSSADSRTILDSGGAERLLGKGDMLFHPNSLPKPMRIQGTFVTDDEIDRVIQHTSAMKKPEPLFDPAEIREQQDSASSGDELYEEAVSFVAERQSASTSLLQRRFQIGYNRAARLIDDMESQGIVSPAKGSRPRDVYTSEV
ncbi:DNA translocase FtsK [Bacillus daqingensis]